MVSFLVEPPCTTTTLDDLGIYVTDGAYTIDEKGNFGDYSEFLYYEGSVDLGDEDQNDYFIEGRMNGKFFYCVDNDWLFADFHKLFRAFCVAHSCSLATSQDNSKNIISHIYYLLFIWRF